MDYPLEHDKAASHAGTRAAKDLDRWVWGLGSLSFKGLGSRALMVYGCWHVWDQGLGCGALKLRFISSGFRA